MEDDTIGRIEDIIVKLTEEHRKALLEFLLSYYNIDNT